MSKLILTTVGTSIITKGIYDKNRFQLEIDELVNGIKSETIANYNNLVKDSKNAILRILANNHLPIRNLSAEMASLKLFKKEIEEDDVIVLISTNTEDGKFCTQVTYEVLKDQNWCNINPPIIIEGFKLVPTKPDEDIAKSFIEAGINNLRKEIDNLLKTGSYDDVFFNITGGFKGIIPFATIIAINENMTIFYLYEESNKLIKLNTNLNCSQSKVTCESQTSEMGG